MYNLSEFASGSAAGDSAGFAFAADAVAAAEPEVAMIPHLSFGLASNVSSCEWT